MGEMKLQTDSENEEQSLAAAALEQAYSEAEQQQTRPIGISEAVAAVNRAYQAIGQEQVRPISALAIPNLWPEEESQTVRFFAGAPDIYNSLTALGLTDTARAISSLWEDAAESFRLASGVADGIGSSISAVSALNNTYDTSKGIVSIVDATRRISAWQDQQRQREGVVLEAFADVGRSQGPSILWREAVHSVYEFAPAPPAEKIEVVQIDDQITLESLSAALAEGRLPWREVLHLAMQHMPSTKPGRKEPPIPEQLTLVEGWYAVQGKMLQQRYCDRVGISKASLNRYERNCKALGLI